MLYYFRESFKSSIKVKMEQQNRESMNFEEMLQKTVNAEAKAGLRSSIMVRDLDAHYLRATACLITLSQRCRAKGPRTSLALRNLSPKISSLPRHVMTWRSRLKKMAKKRKPKSTGGIVLTTEKNCPWLLALTPRPQKIK